MNNDITKITEDFTKVIQFKILRTILKNWKTLENFKREWDYQATHNNKEANRIFKLIWTGFNVDTKTIRALTQTSDGKKQAKKIKANLDSKRLVFVGKKTATYKSGKKFETDSWFYIPFETLFALWNHSIEGENPFDISSSYYTKDQRDLIVKYVLNIGKKERTYNKTEAFNNYQKNRKQKTLLAKDESELSDKDIESLIEDIV